MQDAGREWLGAVCHAPFSSSTPLSLSNATHRQFAGDPNGFKTAFAFSAKLITKHPELTVLIPAEPMRAQQTMPAMINRRDGSSGHDRFAHSLVQILLPSPSGTRHSPSD